MNDNSKPVILTVDDEPAYIYMIKDLLDMKTLMF